MKAPLNQSTIHSLSAKAAQVPSLTATVGLDAFVDEIIRVVDHRESVTTYKAIETIQELGKRIISAAGQSTNLELVVERVKLGGNGPIMANALAALGPAVTCIGPLGDNEIHPAFAEIAARAELVTLGAPGHTDALEFDDGKLMLGKLETLADVTWKRLQERMSPEEIGKKFSQASLVALVNWTMLPAMSDIWKELLLLLAASGKGAGRFFFDLADPEKHSDQAVAAACLLLTEFQNFGPTTLGLNEKEAFRVGNALGYTGGHHGRNAVHAVSAYISDTLALEQVVVHPRAYAVVAAKGKVTADVDGPFTDNPLISTGAGDHFNAGFCLGKLLGLADDEAATTAVATSGYYVRNAASPTLQQLIGFLESQATGE
jgi:hypothetical protein